jgi:hypothetical protein
VRGKEKGKPSQKRPETRGSREKGRGRDETTIPRRNLIIRYIYYEGERV